MDTAQFMELIAILAKPILEMFCPKKIENFEKEFADWAQTTEIPQVCENAFTTTTPSLDTSLVAGILLQVLAETGKLPFPVKEKVSLVRKQMKDFLITHMSGDISLHRFYRLLKLIDERVQNFFTCMGGLTDQFPAFKIPSSPRPFEDIDKGKLQKAMSGINLPWKKGRKVNPLNLQEFLLDTKGGWFRVLDFELHFSLNKKTAWVYLNQLFEAGILTHNTLRANRVRYALDDSFRTAKREIELHYRAKRSPIIRPKLHKNRIS